MTITEMKAKGCLLYEVISGSTAYHLNLPSSDIDLKGVFIMPKDDFYGLNYIPQIADEKNDEVYYEIGRFVELLLKNNPNILEMLAVDEAMVQYRHPLFKGFAPSIFLSQMCKDTFAGFAKTQIKRARGLNKKILRPMEKERKDVLDFCYIPFENGSKPLKKWLEEKGIDQINCGLVKLPNMRDLYALYHGEAGQYKGILRKENANELALSAVEKGAKYLVYLSFNKDGYSRYCKDYKAYWDWVAVRNEARYESTLSHGKRYDAKNMMHTFRLLDMAYEILSEGKIIVRRPNREELLSIRNGDWEYEELLAQATVKLADIEIAAENSMLPKRPNRAVALSLLKEIRKEWYG